MNIKTKATLIVWWIILFFWWWAVFVMSLIQDNEQSPSTDITGEAPKAEEQNNNWTWSNQDTKDNNQQEDTTNEEDIKATNWTWDTQTEWDDIEKKEHSLKILSYNKIVDNKTQKLFKFKYKKESWGTLNYENYDNLEEYNKELVYKLATKSDDFDLAIIPWEWFDDIWYLSDVSFKIKAPWFDISSIFDYNFNNYIKDNNIKAIPFGIDPIVWYTNKNINTYQTFETWKDIIVKSDRISEKDGIKNMPIFLGYDNMYLNYLEDNNSLFPVFDYIYKYYIFKDWKQWVELVKDLWTNIIHKTFDFKLYKKLVIKYRKYEFCKNNEKMCFILDNDSTIIYDFLSNWNFYKENDLNIYKNFRIRPENINKTTLALNKNTDEYPAKSYIMIINPNIKQENLLKFLQTYIKMWQNNDLPFYKNIISPFVWNWINEENNFLSKYLWRFIIWEKFWIWLQNNLSKKELNYLRWDINIDLLF